MKNHTRRFAISWLIPVSLLLSFPLSSCKKETSYTSPEPEGILFNSAGYETSPKVIKGDTVFEVWTEDRDTNCESEMYFHRSTYKGKTWKLEKCLSYISPHPYYPTLGIWNSNVYVFWLSRQDDRYGIYYRRSTNAGESWEPSIPFTTAGKRVLYSDQTPCFTVIGQTVLAFWGEYLDDHRIAVQFKRSTDGGTSWEPSLQLTTLVREGNTAPSEFSFRRSALLLIMIWRDDRDGFRKAIYFKRSTDGGKTWGLDTRLVNSPEWLLEPNLAVTGSAVHLAWQDIRDGNWEIYYKHSTDGGLTWCPDIRFTSDPGLSKSPQITSEGTTVGITWDDRRGDEWKKYRKCSTDGGRTWGSDSVVGSGQSGYLAL